MEEVSKRVVHPSLPANYVTLVDLRERWMQKQKQKKLDEDTRNEALPIPLPLNVDVRDDDVAAEGKDGGVGDGGQLEKKQDQLPEKSVVSNPNPKCATRISSHGDNRRPIETRSCRWGQVSQPKPPPLQAPRVVQLDEAKALPPPVIRVSQSKQPPLEAMKVESRGGIHSSGRKVDNQKLDGAKMEKTLVPTANKRNNKDGGFDIPVENVDDGKLDGVKMEEKKNKRNKKKSHKKKNVVQSQPGRGVLDPNDDGEGKKIPEHGFEDGSGNKNMDDNTRDGVEGKCAGLSLSRGKGENSGDRSIVVRNQVGRIKGGHGKFEGRVMNERRNHKKDVAQSQTGGGVLDPNDDGDEAEGKLAGLSLSKETGETSGGGSITVRTRYGGIRGGGRGGISIVVRDRCGGIRGGHCIFERGVIRESSGLVWVKKGEASEIGAVPREEAGKKRG